MLLRQPSFFTLFCIFWVFLLPNLLLVNGSVGYDHKAITINGQRRILISGSIHYPRSTPEVRKIYNAANVVFLCLSNLWYN